MTFSIDNITKTFDFTAKKYRSVRATTIVGKMATSMCSRCFSRQILFLCKNNPTQSTTVIAVRGGKFTDLFRRKKEELREFKPQEIQEHREEQTRRKELLESLRKRTSIETRRAYTPPADLEEKAFKIVKNIYLNAEKETWLDLELDDRFKKFRVLTKMMKEFDHSIPNFDLNNMEKVQHAVEFFKTPVRDTSALEDLSKLKLPDNLHINLDPIRYSSKTEGLFGISVFGKETEVRSIKYRRKYGKKEQ